MKVSETPLTWMRADCPTNTFSLLRSSRSARTCSCERLPSTNRGRSRDGETTSPTCTGNCRMVPAKGARTLVFSKSASAEDSSARAMVRAASCGPGSLTTICLYVCQFVTRVIRAGAALWRRLHGFGPAWLGRRPPWIAGHGPTSRRPKIALRLRRRPPLSAASPKAPLPAHRHARASYGDLGLGGGHASPCLLVLEPDKEVTLADAVIDLSDDFSNAAENERINAHFAGQRFDPAWRGCNPGRLGRSAFNP